MPPSNILLRFYSTARKDAGGELTPRLRRSRCVRNHVSPGQFHRVSSSLDRAGKAHFGQAAVCGNLIATEEDAVAAIDDRAITPGGAGEVQRAAAAVHDL